MAKDPCVVVGELLADYSKMAHGDILFLVEVTVEEALRGDFKLLDLSIVLDEVKLQIRHLLLDRFARLVEVAPVKSGAGDRFFWVCVL